MKPYHRAIWIPFIFGIALAIASSVASAAGSPSAAVRECSAEAANRKGDERKEFMTQCLKGKGTSLEAEVEKAPVQNPCESGSAMGSIECMKPSWDRSEKALNRAFTAAQSRLRATGFEGLDKKLLDAQRDWIKFRESHCRFNAAMEVEGNAWHAFWFLSCMAVKANHRTKYLSDLQP